MMLESQVYLISRIWFIFLLYVAYVEMINPWKFQHSTPYGCKVIEMWKFDESGCSGVKSVIVNLHFL